MGVKGAGGGGGEGGIELDGEGGRERGCLGTPVSSPPPSVYISR